MPKKISPNFVIVFILAAILPPNVTTIRKIKGVDVFVIFNEHDNLSPTGKRQALVGCLYDHVFDFDLVDEQQSRYAAGCSKYLALKNEEGYILKFVRVDKGRKNSVDNVCGNYANADGSLNKALEGFQDELAASADKTKTDYRSGTTLLTIFVTGGELVGTNLSTTAKKFASPPDTMLMVISFESMKPEVVAKVTGSIDRYAYYSDCLEGFKKKFPTALCDGPDNKATNTLVSTCASDVTNPKKCTENFHKKPWAKRTKAVCEEEFYHTVAKDCTCPRKPQNRTIAIETTVATTTEIVDLTAGIVVAAIAAVIVLGIVGALIFWLCKQRQKWGKDDNVGFVMTEQGEKSVKSTGPGKKIAKSVLKKTAKSLAAKSPASKKTAKPRASKKPKDK